jgi:hypothetical protein
MTGLPNDPYRGNRIFFEIELKVSKVILERSWLNLWLKKVKKIEFSVVNNLSENYFENRRGKKIYFSKEIGVLDFSEDFKDVTLGDVFKGKVGYADKEQQYYHRVYPFVMYIGEMMLLCR